MQRSEAAHRRFFESSPTPSYVIDAESLRIVAANEAALQLYGYSKAEFLQLTLRDLRYRGWLSVEVFDFQPDGETVARNAADYLRRTTNAL